MDPKRVENRCAVAFRDHDIVNRSGTMVRLCRAMKDLSEQGGPEAGNPARANLTGLHRSAARQSLNRRCRRVYRSKARPTRKVWNDSFRLMLTLPDGVAVQELVLGLVQRVARAKVLV
jgi:hypothetical protein